MRKMKAAAIVLDFDLYPRQQIDAHHLREMIAAEEAGAEFPPVIIDCKSKRCTDGFHRVRKQLKVYGDGAEIDVIEKAYKAEADMFLDAVRYNASHGRALNPFDRAHCAIVAEEMQIDPAALAQAMSVTVNHLTSLRSTKVATLTVKGSGRKSAPVAIKRTIGHMAGKPLTRVQAETNKRLGGMNQLFYVNQLIMLIDSKLLDSGNEKLMEGLRVLAGKLGKVLK